MWNLKNPVRNRLKDSDLWVQVIGQGIDIFIKKQKEMSATIEAYAAQLKRHADKLSRLLQESLIDTRPCEFKDEDDFVNKMAEGIVSFFLWEIRSNNGNVKDFPRTILHKIILEMNEDVIRRYYRAANCD